MNDSYIGSSLDKELVESIYLSVRRHKQDDAVAERLIAWVDELARGGTTLESMEEISSHFRHLLNAIVKEDD